MTEQELRQHRCCFSGHRPEKLGASKETVINGLKKEIRSAIADGFQTFISGMARGVDIWAAEIVLALRDEGAAVRLICASPYRGFESRWSRDWQERYRRSWGGPTWCGSFVQHTGGIAFREGMSGWWIIRQESLRFIMEGQGGRGIRLSTPSSIVCQ